MAAGERQMATYSVIGLRTDFCGLVSSIMLAMNRGYGPVVQRSFVGATCKFFSSGLQVNLRVVPNESYGAAMLYFTGRSSSSLAVCRI